MVLPFCLEREKVQPCWMVSWFKKVFGVRVVIRAGWASWPGWVAQVVSNDLRSVTVMQNSFCLEQALFVISSVTWTFLFVGVGCFFICYFQLSFFPTVKLTLGLSHALYHDKNLIGKLQWMSRIAEQFVYFPLGSLWFPRVTFGAEETSLPVRVTGKPGAQLLSATKTWFKFLKTSSIPINANSKVASSSCFCRVYTTQCKIGSIGHPPLILRDFGMCIKEMLAVVLVWEEPWALMWSVFIFHWLTLSTETFFTSCLLENRHVHHDQVNLCNVFFPGPLNFSKL